MRLSDKQIKKVASLVSEGLKGNPDVVLLEKAPVIEAVVEEVIRGDIRSEVLLDQEVKKLMEVYSKQIESGEVDSRKIFGMIKAKLAKEKGIVL